MFTRNSIVLSNNIKTPLTAISRVIGNILQLTYGQLVKQLFSNQEQGFAYDPNDLTTLYRDAAGIIPVTAAGQPVGLVLDKSKGLGLGGELNTGAWNLAGGWTITNGIATHAVGAPGSCNLGGAVLGKWYKYRARVVNRAGSFLIACNSNIVININTPSDKIYDIYATSSVGGNGRLIDFYAQSDFDGDVYVSEVSVKEIRGNHAYQSVSASRPILQRNATTGAYYLAFDGVDDFLRTNNIDFTATDKVSLFAGVRKLSDVAIGILVELSADSGVNNGSFRIGAPASSSQNYSFFNKGSIERGVIPTGFASPISNVLSASGNISADITRSKVNGANWLSSNLDLGVGNYGNYPLYIGRRAGTSFPFNGHLYSLIGIGRLTTDSETIALEKSIAKNTGVTLNV